MRLILTLLSFRSQSPQVASDVEAWCEQLSDVLERARETDTYVPIWYAGSTFRTKRLQHLTSGLNAMTSLICSASHPLGSSSGARGSSGGGSSGGGGW